MCCRNDDGRPRRFTQSRRVGLSRRWPEHSIWRDSGRVRYTSVNDDEALAMFRTWPGWRHLARTGDGPRGCRGDTRRGQAAEDGRGCGVLLRPGDKDCFEVARLTEESD